MTADGSLVGGAGHAAARAVVVPVVQRSWDHPEEHPSDQGVWRYAIVFVNFEAKQVTYIGAHQHDQGCVRAIKVTGGGGAPQTCARAQVSSYHSTKMIVCLQVALCSDARSDILDWPVLFESRIQPVTCPIAFCAQLEATLTGTPSSISELFFDLDRVVLALRRTIAGMQPCSDPGRTALKPTFADVTDSGTFSKVGFGCGFAFRAQKNWKVRA